MIVLSIVLIAAVYTMQIISQSNRLDFLPPDVAPARLERRAVLHEALIYKGRGGVGVEWMRGGKAEIHSLPGDCFWSLVQVPRC